VVGCAAFALAVSTAAAGPFGETAPQPALRAGPDRELAAAFRRRSYRPGDRALVVITGHVGGIELGVFRVGPEPRRPRRKDVLLGVPVTEPRHVSWAERRGSRRVPVWVGKWPSGFYFARIRTPDGRVAYAPFIVRPRARGRARLAVVLPTSTWQAYNLRDVDGNGIGDSWYADPAIRSVDLTRPYMNRGVPPHFRKYDLGFIRWLYKRGKDVDFFADDDLARFRRGAGLAKLYDLVVFPGHEEYVTAHAYDVVEAYRNAGGNLIFLSANNFFARVDRRGDRIYRIGRWRDLGRPEAALVGVQYLSWYEHRYPNAPYVVRGAHLTPWIFEGTGLRNSSAFGRFGIEIDARTPWSPRGTRILAAIPDVFGPGHTAHMTYYETAQGAKVFAAGALNFGGAAELPPVGRLLENVWARLAQP
jgi:hypothetical protein